MNSKGELECVVKTDIIVSYLYKHCFFTGDPYPIEMFLCFGAQSVDVMLGINKMVTSSVVVQHQLIELVLVINDML